MIINTAGEYTLQYTATDACGNSTTVERDLVVEAPPIYGAVWDGSNSPQWTRTQASANFSDPQPAVNNGTGSSPFDNIMPWSGMQIVEDANAGTLVSIPKFYYNWIRSGASMELQISSQPQEGFFVSPAHADRGDGFGERDVVYVGRYNCADANYKSASGVMPKCGITRANFRTNIHALGSDVWQQDFALYWTIRMLYLVEFANWDSQSCIGYGGGNGSVVENMGATDSMQYHTGTVAINRTTYGAIQYRHIEALWSNCLEFVDGIVTGNGYYVFRNPSTFSDSIYDGHWIGNRATASGVPLTFTNITESGYEYALYPESVSGEDYTTRTCDRWIYSSEGRVLSVGGSHAQNQQYGLFYTRNNTEYGSESYIGSRLMKLPSA